MAIHGGLNDEIRKEEKKSGKKIGKTPKMPKKQCNCHFYFLLSDTLRWTDNNYGATCGRCIQMSGNGNGKTELDWNGLNWIELNEMSQIDIVEIKCNRFLLLFYFILFIVNALQLQSNYRLFWSNFTNWCIKDIMDLVVNRMLNSWSIRTHE